MAILVIWKNYIKHNNYYVIWQLPSTYLEMCGPVVLTKMYM